MAQPRMPLQRGAMVAPRPRPLARVPARTVRVPARTERPSPATGPGPSRALGEAVAIRERMKDDFYRLGELLVVLAQAAFFRALGYASFEELLRANDLPGRTTAYKLMAIAKAFPRDEALAVGRARAYALLRLAADGGTIEPAAPGEGRRLGVRDLHEAARQLREASGRKRGRTPRVSLNRARRLRALLRRRGAEHVRVRTFVVGAGRVWFRVELPDSEAHVLEAA